MKVILIGFMGVGKTTIAKELSLVSKLPFFDTDQLVLQETNFQSMDGLFFHKGESFLRSSEERVAEKLQDVKGIIATGGGVIVNPRTMAYLRNEAAVIFLYSSFATLALRLQEDQSRPLFKQREEAESLYHLRQPLYRSYADYTIEVEKKNVEEVTEAIWQVIHSDSFSGSPRGANHMAKRWEL